jgi:hypothetical protein
MTLQSCPICNIGGISLQDDECPQCKSQLKIHHVFQEIDQKLQQGNNSKSTTSLLSKPLLLLYAAFSILLLGTMVMGTSLFFKIQAMETQMSAKIKELGYKADESKKSYHDIQVFKAEINSTLSKDYELIAKLQVESEIIGRNIIELKEQVATKLAKKITKKNMRQRR